MALAILRFEGVEGDVARFQADIGHNAFFLYAVGDGTTEAVHGMEVLAAPRFTSPLQPLAPTRRGRFALEVPLTLFDRENRHMQLMSFRNAQRHGPALSDVVPVGAWRQAVAAGLAIARADRSLRAMAAPGARAAPFSISEARRRPEYSTAMFWQALLGLLPQVLPAVAPLLGRLFDGDEPTAAAGAGAGGASGEAGAKPSVFGQLGELLAKPETKALVEQLVQIFAPETAKKPDAAAGAAGGGTSGIAAPKALGRGLLVVPRVGGVGGSRLALSRAHTAARGGPRAGAPLARAQLVDGGVVTGPALAGLVSSALPALLPLLQKLATPEMLNTLFANTSPQATLGGLVDVLMDPNRKQFERLWQHTPQVGPNVLPALLLQMGTAGSPIPAYRRIDAVTLSVEGLVQVAVHGVPRVAVRAGRDVELSLTVQAPRPIAGAELHWQLKRLATRETVAHDVVRLERVDPGALPPITVSAAALAALPVPDDYTLCVHLVWKRRDGERIGARRSVVLTLAGEYQFDRVESTPAGAASAEPVPLADAVAYRELWHRVWEGRLTGPDRARRIECRYYYALDDGPEAARMETRQRKVRGADGRTTLRLETGLRVGVGVLARLADALAGAEPPPDEEAGEGAVVAAPLDAERLAALRAPDFRARFAQAATAQVTLRGREGERCALWVYPEVKLETVILKRASAVNEAGFVTGYQEVPVRVPLPALAHFVGTRTDR